MPRLSELQGAPLSGRAVFWQTMHMEGNIMNGRIMKGVVTVGIIVALGASLLVVVRQAYAQSATFSVFKHKVNLLPTAGFRFAVITNEPVNCKCTVNANQVTGHGVGHVALTADSFPGAVPRLSYVSWSSNGNEHSGSFCPPSVVDTGFLVGASCPGGLSGQNQAGVATAGGGVEPTGGGLLVRCSGRTNQTGAPLDGVFIETASATSPQLLRLHNHLTFTVPARVTCEMMDIK